MKNLTLITATLIAASMLYTGGNSAIAQSQSKLSFGLNVGYTSPSGGFSSTDASKEPVVASPSKDTTDIAGYAKGGFHFNVYATYMFSTDVGGMISIGGSMNGYNVAALDENIVTANGGQPIVVTNSGSYYVGEYLIGPYVCIPASDKLKIEFKGLVGLTALNYPTINYSETYFGQTATGSVTIKSSSGFGYSVGAGVEYMISDALGLHFGLAYAGNSASYPSYTQTQSAGTLSESVTHNSPMAMSVGMMQITVGASYNL